MKAWKVFALVVSVLSFMGICTAYGADSGELDTTFGEDGKVLTSFGQYGGQAYAVALQPDGKILAAGSASNGYDLDLAIVRYNEDGALDTSFSVDGKVRTSVGDGDDEITAIAVQDDGYIVAAGYTVTDAGRDFVLVRFTPDGDLDHSFGEGGIIVTPFGNQNDEITAMTIDDEGRIVVCGYVTGTAGMIVAVARYLESGAPDITFGDEGAVLTDIGDDALARSIDIDTEGRIVVTGSYLHAEHTELMALRFLDAGELDKGFGLDGVAVPANSEQASDGYGVRNLEDGRILVAGTVGKSGDLDSALFRFLGSGERDASFGENGVLVTSASQEDDMALAIDVMGNVVGISGYSTFNTKRDFLFVAVEDNAAEGTNVTLNQDTGGFPSGDTSNSVFDTNGQQKDSAGTGATDKPGVGDSVFTTTYFGYTDDVSYAVVLQPDGKAVSVGYSEQDGVPSFAVARFVTPVANTAVGGGNLPVSWILTKEPTSVNRTGAITGGTILASGLTIKQRGVVYSIAPDPVYKAAQDVTNPDVTPTPTPVPGNPTSATGDLNSRILITAVPGSAGNITITIVGGGTGGNAVVTRDASNNMSVKNEDGVTTEGTIATAIAGQTDISTAVADKPAAVWAIGEGTDTVTLTGGADNAVNKSVTSKSSGMVTVNDPSADSTGIGTSAQAATTNRLSSPAITSSVDTSSPQFELSLQIELEEDPLVISGGSPSGEIAAGSAMTYIGVYTSEKSECRYATLPDQDFDFMPEIMATADNMSHIAKVTGLEDGHSYSYYVRCEKSAGKESSTAYNISFRVASPANVAMGPYQSMAETLGNFFVTRAYAENTTATTDSAATTTTDNTTPTSVFDLTSPQYAEEGSTDDGGGPGSYSSILKDLRPGTFYYVRAYAVDENNNVYYGPQVGFKTADACFIATAAYGTLLHPYVKVLRNFRDQYMITNTLGRNLVDLYYHYSPPAAEYIASRPFVRGAVRVALLPVVGMGWLVLHIGFAGLALLAVLLIMPPMLVYRSHRRLEVY